MKTYHKYTAGGVTMDAGYRSFGDGPAAIEMMEKIATGNEFGRVPGNGPAIEI